MTVTFQLEPWAMYHRDCQALWKEHYDELAVMKPEMPMRPDVRQYEALAAAGALSILTARDCGVMVGYVTSVVRPHLHYADVLCGFEDSYYLAASHRRGATGLRLLRAWLAEMKRRGVQKVFVEVKPWLDVRPVWRRLGFDDSGHMMARWVGG